MPQNEFINKLNKDIALSMPPNACPPVDPPVNPPAYPGPQVSTINDIPLSMPPYAYPPDDPPAYPGPPQVSTQPGAQNVPIDPGYKVFGQDPVILTCEKCFHLVREFKLNSIKFN